MTYYVKRAPNKETHISDEDITLCDNKSHPKYKEIKKGLHIKLVTCKKCISKIPEVLAKEMFNWLDSIK